jgi:hypothetical protein
VAIVALAACGLGWVVYRAEVQRNAVTAIRGVYGTVLYDWQSHGGRPRDEEPPGPKWLVDRIGIDYFSNVTSVGLAGGGFDTQIAKVANLHRLEELRLSSSHVTDAGLACLKGLTRLETLSLHATHVSEAGLVHLKDLPRLRTLKLGGIKLTATGVAHLKSMSNLRLLSLDRASIDDSGIETLHRALPRTTLVIEH